MGTDDAWSGRSEIRDLGDSVGVPPDQQAIPGRRRAVNPYFAGAWAIAGVMTVLGVLWLVFSSPGVQAYPRYADYLPENASPMAGTSSAPSALTALGNYIEAGPALLVGGLVLCGALLALHGVRRVNPAR